MKWSNEMERKERMKEEEEEKKKKKREKSTSICTSMKDNRNEIKIDYMKCETVDV
jgi:hypothetical protein